MHGKSSLLNAMLKEERAIVTDIEGTTRDTIEEYVDIGGIPLKIIDTAGIRNSRDIIEKIGIEKAKKIAGEADFIIAIFDGTKELTKDDEEIVRFIEVKKAIIILNKVDLKNDLFIKNKEILQKANKKIIELSALTYLGIEDLEREITRLFNIKEIDFGEDVLITNVRHKNLINDATKSLNEAKEAIISNMPIDIVAISIKNILDRLRRNHR